MEIEQKAPNGPNFGLIVGLFCATLLLVFVLVLFFLHFDFKHMTFHHRDPHPTSQLIRPLHNPCLQAQNA